MSVLERTRTLIASDIETLLAQGQGITKEQPLPRTKVVDKRKSIRRKRRVKGTAHLTAQFAAAVTVPDHDLHRTDKIRFYSATTASVEAR